MQKSKRKRKNSKYECFFNSGNEGRVGISLWKLLKNCSFGYCHSLINFHKSDEIILGKDFLKNIEIEVDFKNKLFRFKKKNSKENYIEFKEHKTEEQKTAIITDTKSSTFLRNLIKFFFLIGVVIISFFIARSLYRFMSHKIEKSLPNYERTSNKEINALAKSFQAISSEIRTARENARKPKPIFS